MFHRITLIGFVGQAPSMRYTEDGTPVPLLADGFQVGDWVLPTTTPHLGYADCPSGITPTPTPTPTPLPTETPTPTPIPEGDAYEPDDPPGHSSIAVGESQSRSLDPYGDQDVIHLWVWSGLHVEVQTHNLGGLASTNLEVPTCSGTFSDTDGGQASRVQTGQGPGRALVGHDVRAGDEDHVGWVDHGDRMDVRHQVVVERRHVGCHS